MSIDKPSIIELRKIADVLGIEVSENTLSEYRIAMKGTSDSYRFIEAAQYTEPLSLYAREAFHIPDKSDNPYGAWHVKTIIKGAENGKLKGKTLAIKDNTNVAELPMMNGAASLSDYIPKSDATIVRRILDEGGTILGKAQCECFCFSGSSFTNANAPVLNPHNTRFSAGGSSSGSAVLVQTNEVDMATGGDQGGSIRIPASWTGVCGMKPTYGLVPYTGIMPIEYTLDHVGPMSKTVEDNALLLEVMAGYDNGLDTRQHPFIEPKSYTSSLNQNIKGLKIGVLKEGFNTVRSDPNVDECVRGAALTLETLGADISEVSCPIHLEAPAIWTVIAIEGAYDRMMQDDGYSSNDKGFYDTQLMKAHHAWRDKVNTLSDTIKLSLMTGYLVKAQYHGITYAKARHKARVLNEAYNRLLEKVDLLLMPTTPMHAHRLPTKESCLSETLISSLEMLANTCPFNITGHPAISIPCGMVHDLPVGMMLVGRFFDESTIYKVADAFEKTTANMPLFNE